MRNLSPTYPCSNANELVVYHDLVRVASASDSYVLDAVPLCMVACGSSARVWEPMTRLTDIDLLSSMLATSSRIRSRKCLRTQSITNRFGASSLSVLGSCSTCSGKIQVLSCCSLISPSRQEIHCCHIEFKVCPFVRMSVAKSARNQ